MPLMSPTLIRRAMTQRLLGEGQQHRGAASQMMVPHTPANDPANLSHKHEDCAEASAPAPTGFT